MDEIERAKMWITLATDESDPKKEAAQMRLALRRIISYLESQPQSPTTASPTTESPSAAGTSAEPLTRHVGSEGLVMVSTVQAIQPLQQALMTLLQDRALTPAVQYSTCMALLEASRPSWETPAPVADGTTSTSVKQDSLQSAALSPSDAAPSPSSESGDEFHRIRWPDGGFWTYASHDIDAFMARCETCDEMVTLRVTQPAAAPATPSVSGREYIGVIGKEPLMDVLKSRAQDVSPEDRARIIKEPATPAPAPESGESRREWLGKIVRETWIEWAKEQPSPKPSWLVPWSRLPEPDKEVDRRIGERIYNMAVDSLHNASLRAGVCEHSWRLPTSSMAHGFDLLQNTDLHPKTNEWLWWCERCGMISWAGAVAETHPTDNVQSYRPASAEEVGS